MTRHIFLAVLALAPVVVLAQPPAPDFTALKGYLNLTDSQMTSLSGVMQNQRQATRSLADESRSKRQAFEAASRAGNTDATTLGNLMLASQAAEQKAQALRSQYQAQAVGLLTADQQTKLKALTDAAALAPQIQEAAMLGLINPPHGGGPGGPGGPGGFARMGRGGRGGPGGPPPPPPPGAVQQ